VGPTAQPDAITVTSRDSTGDRSSAVHALTAFAVGSIGVVLITAALFPFRDDVTEVAPALLLVIPVVVAGALGVARRADAAGGAPHPA
jgi:hypothetical protein